MSELASLAGALPPSTTPHAPSQPLPPVLFTQQQLESGLPLPWGSQQGLGEHSRESWELPPTRTRPPHPQPSKPAGPLQSLTSWLPVLPGPAKAPSGPGPPPPLAGSGAAKAEQREVGAGVKLDTLQQERLRGLVSTVVRAVEVVFGKLHFIQNITTSFVSMLVRVRDLPKG